LHRKFEDKETGTELFTRKKAECWRHATAKER
jgi:hypothetical protein